MSAPRGTAYTVPDGEPLYAVFNDAGELLLASVTIETAGRIIDERQADAEIDRRWLGDMRICAVRRSPAISPLGGGRNSRPHGAPVPALYIAGGSVGFGHDYAGSVWWVAREDGDKSKLTEFSIEQTIAKIDEFSAEAQWHILCCCEMQGSTAMPAEVWNRCVLAGADGARDRYWAVRTAAADAATGSGK